MFLKTWRCITIVLAALALTMESAHVLELPQKMQYDAQMYAAVNTTLYRYFAIVGGVYQVGSIVMAAVLTLLVRKRQPSLSDTLNLKPRSDWKGTTEDWEYTPPESSLLLDQSTKSQQYIRERWAQISALSTYSRSTNMTLLTSIS